MGATEGAYGLEGTGKTMFMVARVHVWAKLLKIQPDHIYSNVSLPRLGVKQTPQARIFELMKVMLKDKTPKIFFISEADRVFPPRFWNDREQVDALLNLWQDRKNNTTFLYDSHVESEKILRSVTKWFWFPRGPDMENDILQVDGFYKPKMVLIQLIYIRSLWLINSGAYDHMESCY